MSSQNYHIDMIMLSNYGHSDGGRETWAYSFIPLLLGLSNSLHLTVYGLTPNGESDNTDELMCAVNPERSKRFQAVFFKVKWPKIPLFFSMFYRLRDYLQDNVTNKTQLVLGVGGLFEMLILAYMRTYKQTTKVLWLRTIFCNEKADRVPFFLQPLLRKIEIHIIKKADILIANGDDIASYYERYGLNVHVIKNGVDMKKWSMQKPVMNDPINVAFIGRLTEAKGIVEFLQMVEMVKRNENKSAFVFHVIGHGPYSNKVKVLAEQGMLFYLGSVGNNELPQMLENYDVCVALTMAKKTGGGGGTSNALLEQLAAGRVIVAWDNIIFRQLLNEDNAYLVKQGDTKGLVMVLNEISLDVGKARVKAAVGKSQVSDYSIESQMEKFHKLVPGLPTNQ